MSNVRIVAVTQPIFDPVSALQPRTAEEFIAYAARVSNPGNQNSMKTATKLLHYLVKNKHWSPFEMVSVTMEIKTTRDIGRQILRHRSFAFQEFSQRYAVASAEVEIREARLQDQKNRQNSIEMEVGDDNARRVMYQWEQLQQKVATDSQTVYQWALDNGIAKEQARAVLPEGMTKSTMYMAGTLRSWIHYCELRMGNGTQKEHRLIAEACWSEILQMFPSLSEVLDADI